MSKYGFNENEIRKTIVTKIDKDGFHKEEVFDGNVDGGSSDFTLATMTVTGETDIEMAIPEVCEEKNERPAHIVGDGSHVVEPGDKRTIALYKGGAIVLVLDDPTGLALDGDASILEGGAIMVTGDFSIGYRLM